MNQPTGCVLVFLRWTPSRSPNRASQYVLADIVEPDGTQRRIEERCQNEHADIFPVRLVQGAKIHWQLKTVDKYGQSSILDGGTVVAGQPIVPMAATNPGVDLMNSNDMLSPPSGIVVTGDGTEAKPVTQPTTPPTDAGTPIVDFTEESEKGSPVPATGSPASDAPPTGDPSLVPPPDALPTGNTPPPAGDPALVGAGASGSPPAATSTQPRGFRPAAGRR